MSGSDIKLSPELKNLLSGAGVDQNLGASIEGGKWYTTLIEYGSSKKRPEGVWRNHLMEHRRALEDEMKAEAARLYRKDGQFRSRGGRQLTSDDLGQALRDGFGDGVTAILRAIEQLTPVKTGRARSSWVATLPNGKRVKAVKHVGDTAAYQRKRRKLKKKGAP
jgi:hypothetical protein